MASGKSWSDGTCALLTTQFRYDLLFLNVMFRMRGRIIAFQMILCAFCVCTRSSGRSDAWILMEFPEYVWVLRHVQRCRKRGHFTLWNLFTNSKHFSLISISPRCFVCSEISACNKSFILCLCVMTKINKCMKKYERETNERGCERDENGINKCDD
jgi:hypothetical protein